MARTENEELVDIFEQFFRRYYSDEVGELARKFPREQKSLHVDWRDLYKFDPDLAEDYLSHPDSLQDYAEEALQGHELPVDVNLTPAHVRIRNLPETESIDKLRTRHLNTLVRIRGTVESKHPVTSALVEAAFECQVCSTLNYVPQTGARGERTEPHECVGCDGKGPFRLNNEQSEFIDRQWIRVQERPKGHHTSADIASVMVVLKDDIVDSVDLGDSINVTGVVKQAADEEMDASVADKYIEASDVTEATTYEDIAITDEEKTRIQRVSDSDDLYDQFIQSVAPTVHGHEDVKKGILLQLFGGTRKEFEDGTTTRGSIHVGLIGDPGTQKDDLLQAATKLAPRSLQTGGKTTTSVGLTAAAERVSGQHKRWEFRAGALVLGDQGLVAVDNLDDMDSSEQDALQEPMTQQTVSLSKGSINQVLTARTSILAAAEPKYGRFDEYESIGDQIDFDPDLISAFDLVYLLADEADTTEAAEEAEHLLTINETHQSPERVQTDVSAPLSPAFVRRYVAYARINVQPALTEDSRGILKEYYIKKRTQTSEGVPSPVNRTSLQTLVRLAEASARVRLSEQITAEDAERAISAFEAHLSGIHADPDAASFEDNLAQPSRNQDNLREIVREIISNLQDGYDGPGAPEEEVIARAEEREFNRDKIKHEIDQLKSMGEIYEPSRGQLRTT